jgi:peroxiredoxin (alkyl hydroperoxide reductase subunit C)
MESQMNLIGKPAPSWSGTAYHNGEKATLSSESLSGKWYVIYWYPLDFTFVCPTEIRGFQSLLEDFEDDGVTVIGASTDSFHSHKAWFADRSTFAEEITHPVLADGNHSISRAFGVLKEDEGISFRGTVIVDPQGNVRSLAINDLDAGRSPSETLRTVQALQSGGLCGADWKKGDTFAS